MTYRLRTIGLMATLGVLANCYAAEAKIEIPNQLPYSKPVQLKDLLSTGENFSGSAAAQFALTPNVGSFGTIHFLKAYLYSSTTTDCTGTLTLRGAVSVLDNNNGFLFSSGQPISFNASAAYKLFQNDGQQALTGYIPLNIRCIGLYLNGGNDTNNSTICTQFKEDCTSGSTCISDPAIVPLTWQPNQTPCGPNNPSTPNPSLYFPSTDAPTGKLWRCTFSGSGALACSDATPSGGFNLSNGLAINNSYAYSSSFIGGTIYQSIVDPRDGSVSPGTNSLGVTQPLEIAISSGHFYVPNILTSVPTYTSSVGFGNIIQQGGTISFTGSKTGFSYAASVAINNNYAYIVDQISHLVSSCTIVAGGALGTCGTAFDSTPDYVNGITVYNKYAYITASSTVSYPTGGIIYCKVGNGTFTNCAYTGDNSAAFRTPLNIAAYNGYVYFSNINTGYIGSCQIDTSGTSTDGSLINCIPQASNLSVTSPGQIAIY